MLMNHNRISHKRALLPLVVSLFFVILLSGPMPSRLSAGTGIDSRGSRVTVPDDDVRVVSLSPGATEILYAMGLREQIAGVSVTSDYPPDFVKTRPKVGGFSTPSLEKIHSLSPDVLILTTVVPLNIKQQLDSLGIQIFVSEPNSFKELLGSIDQFGRLFNREEESAALIHDLRNTAGEVMEAVRSGSIAPVKTFIEVYDNPLYAAGRRTLPGDLVAMAGGRVVPDTDKRYPRISEEKLLLIDPEAVILGHNTDMELFLSSHRHLSSITAISNRKVFVPNPDEFLRPGPRVVFALRDIARFLHPEAFE